MAGTNGAKGVSALPLMLACWIGLATAGLAAWKHPWILTQVAAGGAVVATLGSTLWALAALRRESAGEACDIALRAEVDNLTQKLKSQSEQLREALTTDEVTGVVNRKTFLERLNEVVQRDARMGKSFALLYIDVEGFREHNVKLGRVEGDALLREVSRLLQGVSRGTDYVGRLGGDEFGMILGECEDPRPVVDRLFVALETRPSGTSPRLAVSIGAVTVEDPRYGVDFGELFQMAESALQSCRGTGRSMCARRTIASKAPKSEVVRI